MMDKPRDSTVNEPLIVTLLILITITAAVVYAWFNRYAVLPLRDENAKQKEMVNEVVNNTVEGYVIREGAGFIIDKNPIKYVGVNAYDLVFMPHEDAERTIKLASENGLGVIRLWGFGEGFAEGFQPTASMFNDETFDNLAAVLAVLEAYDMKAIVTLGNYWKDYGGIRKYLEWDGLPNQKPEDLDGFFTNEHTRNRYRMFVEKMLNYKSRYCHAELGLASPTKKEETLKQVQGDTAPSVQDDTRCQLNNDPTILAWELMNEPRSVKAENSRIVLEWISEMAKYIKSIDPNHMVFAGTEGFSDLYNTGGNGPSFPEVAALAEIDAATAHYYAEWNKKDIDLSDLILDWAKQAQDAGKPFIFEEIGFDKREEKNNDTSRIESYEDLFEFIQELNGSDPSEGPTFSEIPDVDGLLLWNWSLKKDNTYGISPNDNKDHPILERIQSYRK